MFTIVVPTRNRVGTLQHCLETCVDEKRDDLTILVSDNMSVDGTRDVIREFERRDPRVKYITPGKTLSMALHHQFALEHCQKGFVGIIGDDDGLLPGGLDNAARLTAEYPSARAIAWTQSDYIYPDSPYSKDLGWHSNQLCLATEEGTELRQAKRELIKVLNAQAEYFTLPGIYHSLIHTSVLDQVRQQSRGPAWINEPAPDVYMFVSAGLNDIPFVYTGRSITLRGASKSSVGAAYFLPSGDKAAAAEHLGAEFPKMHPDWDCPLRPILAIVHSCLQRAIEAGLPHEDFPVDWKNVLKRIMLDIKTAPSGAPNFDQAMAFAGEIAKRLGEASLFNEIKELDAASLRSLVETVPDTAPRQCFELDGLGIASNIHDACRLAGQIYQSPQIASLVRSNSQRTGELELKIKQDAIRLSDLEKKRAKLEEKLQTLNDKHETLKARFDKTRQTLDTLEERLKASRLLKVLKNLRLARW